MLRWRISDDSVPDHRHGVEGVGPSDADTHDVLHGKAADQKGVCDQIAVGRSVASATSFSRASEKAGVCM